MKILSGVLGVLLCVVGCGERIEPGRVEGKPAAVRAPVAVARAVAAPIEMEVAGTVQSEVSGLIAAKTLGAVIEVRVREGDRVRGGDLLVVVDPRQADARLREAEAALAAARRAADAARAGRDAAASAAALAAATEKRYRELFAREATSRQEYDEVEARWQQAEAERRRAEEAASAAAAGVERAVAALAQARAAADDARLTAPYDARVAARLVEPGELAAPGRPLLRLEKEGGLLVEVHAPESAAAAVAPGTAVRVEAGGRSRRGVIERIAPAADPASRTVLLKIRLPGEAALLPGSAVLVALPVGEAPRIAVPESALLRQGQLTGLFVIDDAGIARFRLVRTGPRREDRAVVLSGLPEGARYVAAPPEGLADGMRVEPAS
ncbi:MAG: efflux RND transporter periplasmic adaptor subunit [Desulfobacterales bacterium]